MITTSKHSDSRGRANERARTGIESERARAFFQNIHSHIGQWTFGYILSGAGGGKGGQFKCLGSEERICRGMGMAVSRQSPENALKNAATTLWPASKYCHSCTVSDSSGFKSLFSKDKNPVCSRCSPNKRSVNKEDYLPMSD